MVINAFVETSVIWGRSQLTTCVLYNRLLMDFCDFPDSSVQFRSRSPVGFLSPAWFSIFVAFAFLVRARLPVTWLAGLHCTMFDNFTTVHALRVRDIRLVSFDIGHHDNWSTQCLMSKLSNIRFFYWMCHLVRCSIHNWHWLVLSVIHNILLFFVVF